MERAMLAGPGGHGTIDRSIIHGHRASWKHEEPHPWGFGQTGTVVADSVEEIRIRTYSTQHAVCLISAKAWE